MPSARPCLNIWMIWGSMRTLCVLKEGTSDRRATRPTRSPYATTPNTFMMSDRMRILTLNHTTCLTTSTNNYHRSRNCSISKTALLPSRASLPRESVSVLKVISVGPSSTWRMHAGGVVVR